MNLLSMKEKPDGQTEKRFRPSLVVQWLRICLAVQETLVRSLVWEDPTCHRATKPRCHKYRASALEPAGHSFWRLRAPSLCSTAREATATEARALHIQSSPTQCRQREPAPATETPHGKTRAPEGLAGCRTASHNHGAHQSKGQISDKDTGFKNTAGLNIAVLL